MLFLLVLVFRHTHQVVDTKPLVMIARKPHPWRKFTFNMLPFGHGGICLELLAKALFKSSTIGSTFGTFMCNNGEVSCWM